MPPVCPNGHGSFAAWADRCPECGAYLAGREPIVLLATAPNEPVAALWLDALRRAGVRAFANALGPGFGGFGTNATLEHAVHVSAPDLERARRIIGDPPPPHPRRRPIVANPRRKPSRGGSPPPSPAA